MPSSPPSGDTVDARARDLLELLQHPVRLGEFRARFPYLLAGPDDAEVRRVSERVETLDVMPELKARLRNYPPVVWALVHPPLARRFLALLVDIPLYVIFFGLGAVALVGASEGRSDDVMGLASVAWLVASFFLFFVATEWKLGASPGGYLLGLRVVDGWGGRPSLGACLKRQFMRIFRIGLVALSASAAANARTTTGQMAGGARTMRLGLRAGGEVVRA